jgi:hypothetical protein
MDISAIVAIPLDVIVVSIIKISVVVIIAFPVNAIIASIIRTTISIIIVAISANVIVTSIIIPDIIHWVKRITLGGVII